MFSRFSNSVATLFFSSNFSFFFHERTLRLKSVTCQIIFEKSKCCKAVAKSGTTSPHPIPVQIPFIIAIFKSKIYPRAIDLFLSSYILGETIH